MNPIRDLSRAVTMPFKALFVVGLCALIDAMTSPGRSLAPDHCGARINGASTALRGTIRAC